jgi:hypothetical protein
MHTKFWSENLTGKDHLEYVDAHSMVILKCILEEKAGKLWTAFIWFRIGANGGFVWTQ